MRSIDHGCCFFIEPGESGDQNLNARAVAKMMARQQQDMIASELSARVSQEYLDEILAHSAAMEEETLPDVSEIGEQHIHWSKRPDLLDFIVRAHLDFALLPETLFLTINLLDRYCSKRASDVHQYELVGCTALLIAAKYGDMKNCVPQIDQLKKRCDESYDSDKFIKMERKVLDTLSWAIGHPTVDFFTQLMTAAQNDAEVEHLSAYLCEIALYHREFVSTKPSIMARASLALAGFILGRNKVKDEDWDTVYALHRHLAQPSPTLAQKYSTPRFFCVSQKLAVYMAELADIYNMLQEGSGAAVDFESCLTPPNTPDGARGGHSQAHIQVYTSPPPSPVTPTSPPTPIPAMQSGLTQSWSSHLHHCQNNDCTTNHPLPRILSPLESKMLEPHLRALIDPCCEGCGWNEGTNTWSCPMDVDLHPVATGVCLEDVDWLSMEDLQKWEKRTQNATRPPGAWPPRRECRERPRGQRLSQRSREKLKPEGRGGRDRGGRRRCRSKQQGLAHPTPRTAKP